MTNHEGLPVAGYRAQSDEAVAAVNRNKVLEEIVLRQIDDLQKQTNAQMEKFRHGEALLCDLRWLAVARTQIEQGFTALNRSIFRPGRVDLPADAQKS